MPYGSNLVSPPVRSMVFCVTLVFLKFSLLPPYSLLLCLPFRISWRPGFVELMQHFFGYKMLYAASRLAGAPGNRLSYSRRKLSPAMPAGYQRASCHSGPARYWRRWVEEAISVLL